MLLTAILIGVVGQVFLKLGSLAMANVKPDLMGYLLNGNLWCGLFLYGISTIFYVIALQKIPLSIAYPTISISYIFVIILSSIIFKEKVDFYQILGVLLIMFGVFLIWKK
jgi:multidrug transporter EmrE-like cation transporter